MRLERFEKVDYASFRTFQWPAVLDPFIELNVLLGWNGSGKTTLSNILRSIEKNEPLVGCKYKVKFDTATLTETSDTTSLARSIRVFNDEYVKDTMINDSLSHIFFLGKTAVDYSKEEKRLAEMRDELKNKVCNSSHDQLAQKTAEKIKKVPGINGYRKELTDGNYGVYNKSDFEKRISDFELKLANREDENIGVFLKEDIVDLQQELLGNQTLSSVNASVQQAATWVQDNNAGINACLGKQPQQKLSARVKDFSLEQKQWVEQGVKLHFSPPYEKETCLFCNTSIQNKEELIYHFSTAVVALSKQIVLFLDQIQENERDLKSKYAFANDSQKLKIDRLLSILSQIADRLRDKQTAISEQKMPIGVFDVSDLVSGGGDSPSREHVAFEVECHYVAEQYIEYIQLRNASRQCMADKEKLEDEIRKLDKQVKDLKLKAQNTHEPAEKLNTLFKLTFPYRKIEIANNADQTGYILMRDGQECAFESLSEGERNFIALAYFMTALNDESNKFDTNGVVVIDDPVSSLDKNAIFHIFSIIVGEVARYPERQYFIFTHNLDFFGHLREHYQKRTKKVPPTCRLYNICLTENGSSICELPKLLREHRSDYYYVFSELRKYQQNCSPEDAYVATNLLRRWLETFLEFKFAKDPDSGLRQMIEDAYREADEKSSGQFVADPNILYRFVNHGSHAFFDANTIDVSLLSGAQDRIGEAFNMLKWIDPLHYAKLEKVSP